LNRIVKKDLRNSQKFPLDFLKKTPRTDSMNINVSGERSPFLSKPLGVRGRADGAIFSGYLLI